MSDLRVVALTEQEHRLLFSLAVAGRRWAERNGGLPAQVPGLLARLAAAESAEPGDDDNWTAGEMISAARCSPQCLLALGDDCTCGCRGRWHGSLVQAVVPDSAEGVVTHAVTRLDAAPPGQASSVLHPPKVAARMLGIGGAGVRAAIRRGKLAARRTERGWLISSGAIEDYARRRQ